MPSPQGAVPSAGPAPEPVTVPAETVLPLDGPLTLEQAVRRAAAAFDGADLAYAHGTDNAIDEAAWLLLDALGLDVSRAPDYTRPLDAAERERCNARLARRIVERVPTAYLVGTAWFAGHEFLSDERALVPRSPLAEFVANDCFGVLDGRAAPRVLDLCTGGGCIAIAVALARPAARVDASDLSPEALSLARENVARHEVGARVTLLEGDLFEPVRGPYDLIVSNPPYVDAADLAAMPGEFAHEPALGLGAGEDGLERVRDILAGAAARLVPDGVLVVEVGNSAPAVVSAWPDVPFEWLEFTAGGEGVFLLERATLLAHADALRREASR